MKEIDAVVDNLRAMYPSIARSVGAPAPKRGRCSDDRDDAQIFAKAAGAIQVACISVRRNRCATMTKTIDLHAQNLLYNATMHYQDLGPEALVKILGTRPPSPVVLSPSASPLESLQWRVSASLS